MAASFGRRSPARRRLRPRRKLQPSEQFQELRRNMRHLKSGSKLGKQPAHRRAVLRNLVTNLIEKERIHTTLLRAKTARPLAERMITLGKRDSLHTRRQAAAFLMTPVATKKLFADLAPR